MSAPPYMRLYWGDYSRKTRHLTRAAEHGAYLMLIGALWDAGGKLPADDQTLAAHALLTPDEWEAMKPKIMPFFRVRRGQISQDRVTEELAKYESTSCKRKSAGKAGGRARRGKNKENSEANASHLPTKSESESEGSNVEDKSSTPAEPVSIDDPGRTAWSLVTQVLTQHGGMTEATARRFFGKLLSDHKLEAREMLAAVAGAVSNGTGDPQAYLTRAAQGVAKRKAEPVQQKRVSFV